MGIISGLCGDYIPLLVINPHQAATIRDILAGERGVHALGA